VKERKKMETALEQRVQDATNELKQATKANSAALKELKKTKDETVDTYKTGPYTWSEITRYRRQLEVANFADMADAHSQQIKQDYAKFKSVTNARNQAKAEKERKHEKKKEAEEALETFKEDGGSAKRGDIERAIVQFMETQRNAQRSTTAGRGQETDAEDF